MYKIHQDKNRYFDCQYLHSKEFIIPFVENHIDLSNKIRVLEIGSAESGILKAFTDQGHNCVGIEISPSRVEQAKTFMKREIENNQISFYNEDILTLDVEKIGATFDLIILKDVIEHISNRTILYAQLKKLLSPKGLVFISMPPWRMPFGGHQQMLYNKLYSRLPYFHLLPIKLTKLLLKWDKYPHITEWESIRATRISIDQFRRESKANGFNTLQTEYYFINPNYKFKFNLKPRKQNRIISSIPYLRDFFTTTVYYLLQTQGKKEF